MNLYMLGGAAFAAFLFLVLVVIPVLKLRTVVPTNAVHILQKGMETVSYGKDYPAGNVYYSWPIWLPKFGVQVTILPISNFSLELDNYEAYDEGRLPFVIDVVAFFRISNAIAAAQRVSSMEELEAQLISVLQGAARALLAGSDIEEIMQGRSTFGDQFTNEVTDQLKNWGVEPVKNIELMDIRDASGSKVIHNIMEKKKSHIDMESRQEVAKNSKLALTAEIEAQREVDLRKQEATQTVGIRTVEVNRTVELAKQEQIQVVRSQEKITKEKEMEIKFVQDTKEAEIAKSVQITKAEQSRETARIVAEGVLEAEKMKAEGVKIQGEAKASAEKALLLAPVEAQTTLAKEIGSNDKYQTYLITIEQIKANQAVGSIQAEALKGAEIKMIVNTGDPESGLNKVMDLFSSQGGTAIGSLLEGLNNTGAGKKLLDKVIN